ncbi:signal peptide-containing protein [Cryptosporidium canis]|uniref:Signal peptide-containing protein n=1 Tax=Cryptosporidium canis TaxID=195482 RepID=A0ABQ8P9T4_9CRYT|nr:signal peptide-containing protein [Cryptosporidium canis]
MRDILAILWLFFQVCSSLASNAKISQLFGAVPEDQCMNFNCKKVNSVNYYSACGQSIFCGDCQLETFKSARDICSGWRMGGIERIILAGGSVHSGSRVGGRVFEDLDVDWAGNRPIDVSKCRLENFNFGAAYSAFSSGMYTSLYSTATLSVVILTNKPRGKTAPPLEFQIDLDETMEEIDARGMGIRRKRDRSLCPISHSPNPLVIFQKRTRGRITIVSRSFSIPLDRSGVYRPSEFKLRVRCKGKKECDLKYYRFCLRLSCTRMPESQLAQYKMVQELLKNPPPAIIQQEEDDELDEDEADKGSRTGGAEGDDEEDQSHKLTEKVHTTRKVPKDVSRELQLEKHIVFTGGPTKSSGFLSKNLLFIVSGLAVVIILVLGFLLLLKRRRMGG